MLKELSKSEIEEVLRNNVLGRIGYRQGERVHIAPVSYVFETGSVLCRSYEGDRVLAMRDNRHVCFEVEELYSFNNWKTVVAWGVYEELFDMTEIAHARSLLSELMLSQKALLSSLPPTETSANHHGNSKDIVYYCIRFVELSGRSEREI
jgi:nitroimidazol reductase NimA-like FMN-containing flavoprotein (pyridoxamine 5'-phosphate oxidase superfamily)